MQIDTAYKNVLKKFAEERHNSEEIEWEEGRYFEARRKANAPVIADEEEEEIKVESF